MDTHIAVALAHLLFSVPLAVWILEGFMSGIPREIDETAYIDGYSFRASSSPSSCRSSRRVWAWRRSSASCSAGWSCCWPAR